MSASRCSAAWISASVLGIVAALRGGWGAFIMFCRNSPRSEIMLGSTAGSVVCVWAVLFGRLLVPAELSGFRVKLGRVSCGSNRVSPLPEYTFFTVSSID